ncbi:DUF3168 domain-containing protein [Sphingomonas psychrotolerans]|nr:DUF3168 domain-containing protein [Sphingomonas psychrotolerans]
MSAHAKLTEAVEALLGAHPGVGIAVNGVFDSPPQRAVRPYAVIEDAVLVDWSTKDMIGREGRLAVGLFEMGEDRKRLRALADQIAAAIPQLPSELGEGWRIASLAFLRSRIFREGPGQCAAVIEFRVRMLQAN